MYLTERERRDRSGRRPEDLEPIPTDLLTRPLNEVQAWCVEHRMTSDPYVSVTPDHKEQVWKEIYVLLADRFGIDVDRDPFLGFKLLDWLHYRYEDGVSIPRPEYPDPRDPGWEGEQLKLVEQESRNASIFASMSEQCIRRMQGMLHEILEERQKKEQA